MDLTNIHAKPSIYLRNISNILRDTAGFYLLKGWKKIETANIDIFDDTMLPEILRIQAEGFKEERQGDIIKHSKKFREIFYVIKRQDKIIGYCAYYLKPNFSIMGIGRKSVIHSIAIDREFRNRGFGRMLLEESIKEMKLNGVSAIFLYVSVNNIPAIRIYEETGFSLVKEVNNICGQEEKCYKMELKLV